MIRDRINIEYFTWMCDILCENRFAEQVSYDSLLRYLHDTDFRCVMEEDENRAEDGISLRYRFAYETNWDGAEEYIGGPCSVLEMMLALAIYCEESIMDDPNIGDRTGQWFWDMVVNLGLGGMTDDHFDEYYVEEVVERFLDRKYEPNGKGGLFLLRNCDCDLRYVEIRNQLYWYLDGIT